MLYESVPRNKLGEVLLRGSKVRKGARIELTCSIRYSKEEVKLCSGVVTWRKLQGSWKRISDQRV